MVSVMLEIPLSDFLSSCEPDIIELLDVFQKKLKRSYPERLADNMWVKAYIHMPPAFLAFLIKPVKLFLENLEGSFSVLALTHENRKIIHL